MFTPTQKTPSVISTARGERIYAIGDVHGRVDLLDRLINMLDADMVYDPPLGTARIIFLGDIIDRGPESLACLERIHALMQERHVGLVLGNHEDLMLRSMAGDEDAQTIWLRHGGEQTLESLSLLPPDSADDAIDFGERVTKAVPTHIIDMLETATTHARSGDYLFVHAGVRPGVSFERQDPFDLYFIREDFTESTDWHGAMIVHGHTIVDSVQSLPNRIAVDTGAYRTGMLSCIRLEGIRRKVINVDDGGNNPEDIITPILRHGRRKRLNLPWTKSRRPGFK